MVIRIYWSEIRPAVRGTADVPVPANDRGTAGVGCGRGTRASNMAGPQWSLGQLRDWRFYARPLPWRRLRLNCKRHARGRVRTRSGIATLGHVNPR